MNIFKILNSGHGSVSETNVSAFLGYLLNPSEDHGLKDELLKEILCLIFDQDYKKDINDYISKNNLKRLKGRKLSFKDLVFNEDIFIEVELERAFDAEELYNKLDTDNIAKETQIVDIVILLYKRALDQNENNKPKQNILIRKGEPVAAILIENKIAANPTKGQILNQVKNAEAAISGIDNLSSVSKVYSIYLTPEGKSYEKEWNTYADQIKGKHILWSGVTKESSIYIEELIESHPLLPESIKSEKDETILGILERLLEKESKGMIDPWPETTKHTIKAFMTFISSGFTGKQASQISTACTRFEFYKYCLDSELRSKEQLLNLLKIEDEVSEILGSENYYALETYKDRPKPKMSFYKDGRSIFRIGLEDNATTCHQRYSSDLSKRTHSVKGIYLDSYADDKQVIESFSLFNVG